MKKTALLVCLLVLTSCSSNATESSVQEQNVYYLENEIVSASLTLQDDGTFLLTEKSKVNNKSYSSNGSYVREKENAYNLYLDNKVSYVEIFENSFVTEGLFNSYDPVENNGIYVDTICKEVYPTTLEYYAVDNPSIYLDIYDNGLFVAHNKYLDGKEIISYGSYSLSDKVYQINNQKYYLTNSKFLLPVNDEILDNYGYSNFANIYIQELTDINLEYRIYSDETSFETKKINNHLAFSFFPSGTYYFQGEDIVCYENGRLALSIDSNVAVGLEFEYDEENKVIQIKNYSFAIDISSSTASIIMK